MRTRLCSVNGCGNKHLAKGFCRVHYMRLYQYGRLHTVTRRDLRAADRILIKIRNNAGCWIYTGKLTKKGYAHVRADNRKMRFAHVILYEDKYGPVPDGKELDHLCRNRACCNPDHVEPVTHRENMRRSPLVGRNVVERDACGRFTAESGT